MKSLASSQKRPLTPASISWRLKVSAIFAALGLDRHPAQFLALFVHDDYASQFVVPKIGRDLLGDGRGFAPGVISIAAISTNRVWQCYAVCNFKMILWHGVLLRGQCLQPSRVPMGGGQTPASIGSPTNLRRPRFSSLRAIG
jgi:hypothetical protein